MCLVSCPSLIYRVHPAPVSIGPKSGRILLDSVLICPVSGRILLDSVLICPVSGRILLDSVLICPVSGRILLDSVSICPVSGRIRETFKTNLTLRTGVPAYRQSGAA
jgi:hypothetical protein